LRGITIPTFTEKRKQTVKLAALIPARISSKRLPKKNIKSLGGKPLLFWSIDAALKSSIFHAICVTTESEEISALVRKEYPRFAVDILLRPPELATDTASLNDVCVHFLDKYPEIEILSLMMPTYPFRRVERIKNEIAPFLYSRQIDRVVSVLPESYSTFDYWIYDGHGYQRMFKHVPLWCGAGNAAYIFQRRDYFYLSPQEWPYLLGERTLRIQTNAEESVDIDTLEDFEKAEKICKGYRLKWKMLKVYRDSTHEVITPEGVDPKSFKKYIIDRGVDSNLPILILKPAFPLFSFLRWYECNSSRSYNASLTNEIVAKLPKSGNSQDFPEHYIHSKSYRMLRIQNDFEGIVEKFVPKKQVVFLKDLAEWTDYVEPYSWVCR